MSDLHEAAAELEASGFLPESMREFFKRRPEPLERFAELEAEYRAKARACKPPIAPDKPSEGVENAAIGLGVLTLIALLGQVVVYAMA